MSAPIAAGRPGMTLVELVVSLTFFSIVLMAAARALQMETRVFNTGTERMEVVQNYRYAMGSIEQDVRLAGIGVVPRQPSLVYADEAILAFNADYASNDADDVSAVFYEPDAPDADVRALTRNARQAFPTTSFAYPDSSFLVGGVNSPAETIVFFFADDSASERAGDWALYRQVNHRAPERLAGYLLPLDSLPFFEYTELITSDTAPDALAPISFAALPLAHSAPRHGVAGDTGAAGRIDRVRAVRVNFAASNGVVGGEERIERVSRLIWLHNIRQQVVQTCGDEPLGVDAPGVSAALNVTSGDPEVTVEWDPSPDEAGGEGDIVRYILWRRLAGASDWGDPYLSLPAGNTSYVYVDAGVEGGQSYEYAISAQDCTPSLSAQSGGATVSVPSV